MSTPIIVLIGGGHSAGKHTVCQEINKHLSDIPHLTTHTIELDKLLTSNPPLLGPSRYDFTSVLTQITELQSKEGDETLLILIPGLYSLYDRELRQMASMKVFVDCDADTRLNRWIEQDVLKDQKDLGSLLDHYLKIARPEFNEFIQPTKEFADVVLPSEQSRLGISLICDGIAPLFSSTASSYVNNKNAVEVKKTLLYPRFGVDATDLNAPGEIYDKEKNQYYDLS